MHGDPCEYSVPSFAWQEACRSGVELRVLILRTLTPTRLRRGLPGVRRAAAVVLVAVAECAAAAAAAAAAHAGRRGFQEAAVRVVPAACHRAVIARAAHDRAPHIALTHAQVHLPQRPWLGHLLL